MSPQPPRPNPAIYPRGITKTGHYVHRMRRVRSDGFVSLCGNVSTNMPGQQVGIEGVERNPLLQLLAFDAESAGELAACKKCQERAGRFA